MDTIYDSDGTELGGITLSDKQQALLDAGEEICVIFHTPQLMRSQLGEQSGSFLLSRSGDKIVTSTPDPFKQYAKMQAAIANVRKQEAS